MEDHGALPYDPNQSMLFQDAPHHARLRGLVRHAFSRVAVEDMRARTVAAVDALLDRVAPRQSMDVLNDLAYPLSVQTICDLLGVPKGDLHRFQEWSRRSSLLIDLTFLSPDLLQEALEASHEMGLYFEEMIRARQDRPGDGLLSSLVSNRGGSDRLIHEEILAMATLLFVAGHETTQNLIGNGFLRLCHSPRQLAKVSRNLLLVPGLVEECLRFDPPVAANGRIAKEDVAICGHIIRRGHWVHMPLIALNRDPQHVRDPDRFNIQREDNRHLSFSAGAHFCLGAMLARMVAVTAFERVLSRFEGFRLKTARPRYRPHVVLRGLEELVVEFQETRSRKRTAGTTT